MNGHPLDALSAFLDGELEPQERAAVEGHLRQCAACARHLEELAAVDTLARNLSVEAPAGYFQTLPGRVVHRLPRRARPHRIPVWTWALAAGVIVAVAGPLVLQERALAPTSPAEAPMAAPAPTPADEAAPAPPDPITAEDAVRRAPQAAAPRPTAPPASLLPMRRAGRLEASSPAAGDTRAATAGPREDRALREHVRPQDLEQAKDRDTRGFALAPPATAPPSVGAAPAAPPPPVPTEIPEPDDAPQAAPLSEAVERGAAAEETATLAKKAEAERKEARPRPQGIRGGMEATTPRAAIPGEAQFEALSARVAASVEEARELREAWRNHIRQHAKAPWLDEARVRLVETAAEAYRRSGDPADLEVLRRDARAYLQDGQAPQAERARKALERIPPER